MRTATEVLQSMKLAGIEVSTKTSQGARGVLGGTLERLKISEDGVVTEITQEAYDHNKIIAAYQKQVKEMASIISNLNFEVFKIKIEVKRLTQAVTKTVGKIVQKDNDFEITFEKHFANLFKERDGDFDAYFEKHFAHRFK